MRCRHDVNHHIYSSKLIHFPKGDFYNVGPQPEAKEAGEADFNRVLLKNRQSIRRKLL